MVIPLRYQGTGHLKGLTPGVVFARLILVSPPLHTRFSLHRQTGEVWRYKPAGSEHLMAAAAPAFTPPPPSHGFLFSVTGWAQEEPGNLQAQYRVSASPCQLTSSPSPSNISKTGRKRDLVPHKEPQCCMPLPPASATLSSLLTTGCHFVLVIPGLLLSVSLEFILPFL